MKIASVEFGQVTWLVNVSSPTGDLYLPEALAKLVQKYSFLKSPQAEEFLAALPPDYELHRFNTRKADGSKARRRGAKARRSGAYALIPFSTWRDSGQDDIVACPLEKSQLLPRTRLGEACRLARWSSAREQGSQNTCRKPAAASS